MATYDFVSKKITELQVKSIIRTAGYQIDDYRYQSRVSDDGYVVTGEQVMAISRLENAAKRLNIPVVISSPPDHETPYVIDLPSVVTGDGSDYMITIVMDQQTADDLTNQGYSLYAFKAVQSSQSQGKPVIWFRLNTFATQISLKWSEHYQAYTSESTIIANGNVTATNAYDVKLGETLTVTNPSGTGDLTKGGPENCISIFNTEEKLFTCGIAQQIKDASGQEVSNIMCAFPLHGGNLDRIAPIEKVLLVMATGKIDTGTVIEQSSGPGLLIDLTADNSRLVHYEMEKTWSPSDKSWTTVVDAGSMLTNYLIDVSQPTQVFRRKSLVLG